MGCLDDVREEVLTCCKCPLCQTRTKPVPGEGSEDAEVVFVGEAPGKDEDLAGRPFVGRAGKLLRKTIEEVGFKKYYITNVVKCRPPENRTPFQNEVDACKPYLMRELECIKPKLVIALGKTAMKALLGFDAPIKDVRGKVFKTKINEVQTKVIVTYHPAAVLRNPKLREEFKKDLVKAYNEVYKQRSLTEFK